MLVEPAGVRTPERSTCHAYRAVARAVEMESDAQSSPADPDLISVIASWATLPAVIKVGIMALVDATKSHALNTCVNTSVNKNSCA